VSLDSFLHSRKMSGIRPLRFRHDGYFFLRRASEKSPGKTYPVRRSASTPESVSLQRSPAPEREIFRARRRGTPAWPLSNRLCSGRRSSAS